MLVGRGRVQTEAGTQGVALPQTNSGESQVRNAFGRENALLLTPDSGTELSLCRPASRGGCLRSFALGGSGSGAAGGLRWIASWFWS